MSPKLRKSLLISAEVALILVIIGLLFANWLPVIIGARPFRTGP